MKRIWRMITGAAIFLILCGAAVIAQEATPIHFVIRDCTGSAADRVITITPLDGPKGFNGDLSVDAPITLRSSGGIADTNLVIGNYMLTFSGSTRAMQIFWPGDATITNAADPRVQRSGVTSVYVATNNAGQWVSAGTNVTLSTNGNLVAITALTDSNAVKSLALPLAGGTMTGGITNSFLHLTPGHYDHFPVIATDDDGESLVVDNDTDPGFFFNGAKVQADSGFFGDGSGLTGLNGASVASGTLADARLSSNVPLKTGQNNFTGSNNISGSFTGNGAGLTNVAAIGTLSAFQCGAKGDGVTDDTASLQRWLYWACTSNLIAVLPPAPGGFYKITDTLWITNAMRFVNIHGTGGAMWVSDAVRNTSRIKQMTAGKDGIVITNDASNINIQGIALDAASYNYSTRALAFDGPTSDSDACRVSLCGIQGFGKGLFLASVADMTVESCAIGKCGDGIYVGAGTYTVPPVINEVTINGCQVGYNRSNQLHIASSARVNVNGGDLGAGDDGSGQMLNSRSVLAEAGTLSMQNMNIENGVPSATALPAIAGNNCSIRAINIETMNTGGTGANNYSFAMTNASLILYSCNLNAVNTAGYPILSTDVSGAVFSDRPQQVYIPTGTYATSPTVMSRWASLMNYDYPTMSGQSTILPDWFTLKKKVAGGKHEDKLMWGAYMEIETGSSAQTNVDLLQYAKDQIGNLSSYGLLIHSNTLSSIPVLVNGDAYFWSSNGRAYVIEVDAGGTRTTNSVR